MRTKLLTILFLLLSIDAFATNYYFSAGGNDGNNGLSPATAWQTIAKFNSVFASKSPGDNFLFNRGDVFVGQLIIGRAGSAGLPITVGAYGSGAKPVISGFAAVSSWSNLGANIWESTTAVSTLVTLNMVTINGVNTAMGRTPNYPTQYTWQSHGGTQGTTNTNITSSDLNSGVINWAGAELALWANTYIMSRHPVLSQAGSVLTYNSTAPQNTDIFQNSPGYFLQNFFIENDVRTLDVQNEWYYNPSTKKIRIYSTVSPTNVKVATVPILLSLPSFKDYIIIRDLAFEGSNGDAILVGGVNHTTIVACDFNFIGGNCVTGGSFGGPPFVANIIDTCLMNQVQNMGIDVWEDYYVRGNTIKNVGMLPGMNSVVVSGVTPNSDAIAVRTRFNGAVISGNNFDSIGLVAIDWYGSNLDIGNNFINHACNGNSRKDGGAIYMWNGGSGSVLSGNKIHDNIILNTGLFSQGIYFDSKGNGSEVYNNSIQGGEWGIYLGQSTYNINVHNNTVYDPKVSCLTVDARTVDPSNNYVFRSNIFFAKQAAQFCLWTLNGGAPTMPTPFTSDSNYFARPINDNLTIQTYLGGTNTQRSLAQWRTLNGTDANSNKSPRTISNVNQLEFYYNETGVNKNVSLSGNYVDVRNTPYSGTITLLPYTSIVLINTGSLITPTITWNNPSNIVYGTALSGTQLNASSGGVPGSFAYNPASGTVLNAGTYTLNVVFTPTDQSTYSTASKNVTLVVTQASATLTYSNLTQTYNGLPLAPTITTNPAGLTVVSTTYNGVGSTPINAGVYNVVSGLTNQNYFAPSINGTFTINKASATLNVSNLAQVYDGSQKPVTVTTSPAGLSGVSVTYNASSTPPTNAGSYNVVVTLNNTNYTATTVNTVLVISKATPTVSWANPAAITYPTALSGTQLNATASVAGTFTYSPVSGTVLNAGTQTLSVNFVPTDNTNYNSVNNTTVTLVVNKGTATISLSNLAQTYDGTSKSAIATTSPAGLNVVTITYNGSATLPVNAGTYAVVASLNNSNYNATNASGNLVIAKATATLSLSNTNYTYNGTQRSVTVTTAPAGLTVVSVTYDGSATAPTNTGSYAVVVTLNNANYQGSISGTLTIIKATPVISWSNPASITYGTGLSGTQLNATSGGVAGSFVYTPPSGTILNAGTQTLIADFTPTDGSNYNSVNGTSVTIIVNKATATITLSNLNQFFDGSPKPVTVTVSPNVGVITTTYNGSGTAPSAVGSYSVVSSLSNTNYTATNATGTLTISNSSASVTITNTSQTYDGSPKPVTVTTNPAGLPTDVTYDDVLTVPTNAGTYSVTATINDGGVHTGSASATLIINKANPVVSWSNPSAIVYGTALSGTELNATASVAGSFAYTPTLGTVLNAGTQVLSVNFTPTDAANYNSVNGTTVSIVVNKAAASLSISNISQAYDGSPKPVTVTSSPAGLTVISVTYNGSATVPSAVGSYAVSATLNNPNYIAPVSNVTLTITSTSAGISISNLNRTYSGLPLPVTVTTNPSGLSYAVTYNGSGTAPTNAGNYTVIATLNDGTHTGADTQTLVVAKATPVLTWANPTPITYGTLLSGVQLNATATTAGSFVYAPPSGTLLNAGTQSLSVSFTPTDGGNFNPISKVVSITVNKALAGLTLSNLLQTYDGNPKPVIVTSAPSVSGITVTYNGSSTVPVNAGSYAVVGSLVNANYQANTVNGTLVIAQAIPVLSWAVPAPIAAGTALSALQQNATASVAGVFVYNPPAGTVLPSGTQLISAVFTPSDTNYAVTSISVPISVYGNFNLDFWINQLIFRNE